MEKNTGPVFTGEDENYEYFEGIFEGKTIRMRMSKATGEILFDADDCLKVLGLGDNVNEFLSTDKGLDTLNDFKRDHPDIDVFGEKGLFRKA